MSNLWMIDPNKNGGILLAFDGDKEFINKSINFVLNYKLSNKIFKFDSGINYIYTSMEKLKNSLATEGYCKKYLELKNSPQKEELSINFGEEYANKIIKECVFKTNLNIKFNFEYKDVGTFRLFC